MRKWLISLSLVLCGCKSPTLHTAFLTPVCIKPHKEYRYHVCSDIEIVIDKEHYYIPKGFRTDLASIPRLMWPILSPAHSSLIRAAIVHDWFYRKTCEFTRKQADLIFYHMLKNDGVSRLRANALYLSVRLCGWRHFKEDYCEWI